MKAQLKSISEQSSLEKLTQNSLQAESKESTATSDIAEMLSRLLQLDEIKSAEHSRLVKKLVKQIEILQSELQEAKNQILILENLAHEDTLVPLLNRRGFTRELERTISYVQRYKTCASLIYVDIDKFKSINDRFGHLVGDKVLSALAEILVENTRTSDVIGRIGGDEFAVILHHASYEAAESRAKQLADIVSGNSLTLKSGEVKITISAGVAEITSLDSPKNILSRADSMMYAGKQNISNSKEI